MSRNPGRLFDSHTHVNYSDVTDEEREDLIRSILESDVAYIVDVGFDVPSSRLAAESSRPYPWYFAAAGVHPHDAASLTDEAFAQLCELADDDKVLAIGEIGLDYYRDISPRDVQKKAFISQIRLALDKEMPMLIHDRDSGGDTIDILRAEGAFDRARTKIFPPDPETGCPDARVLLHCYSGDAKSAEGYIAEGMSISIAGPVTYKKSETLHEVARSIPISRMLIETDAPFLAPVPYRGKRNRSPYIEYTAGAIAELRGMSYEKLADATTRNAKRFFGLEVGSGE